MDGTVMAMVTLWCCVEKDESMKVRNLPALVHGHRAG